MTCSTLAILGLPGGSEWIVIALIGLLVFGRRLPEVGRSLGRSIVEFKKGIKGVEDEIESESEKPLKPYDRRLGGDEEQLRRLQQQSEAADELKRVSQQQQQSST